MNKHLAIKISGRVQGVWFREQTKRKALELGITGFVRNEDDGSVFIEAEGGDAPLSDFLAWCRQGPPLAVVENVEEIYSDELMGYGTFDVAY